MCRYGITPLCNQFIGLSSNLIRIPNQLILILSTNTKNVITIKWTPAVSYQANSQLKLHLGNSMIHNHWVSYCYEKFNTVYHSGMEFIFGMSCQVEARPITDCTCSDWHPMKRCIPTFLC